MIAYQVINKSKGTAWNIGTLVVAVSIFDCHGCAGFTDKDNPGACIHAHKSEIEPIGNVGE